VVEMKYNFQKIEHTKWFDPKGFYLSSLKDVDNFFVKPRNNVFIAILI